jgi:hypothetical protein
MIIEKIAVGVISLQDAITANNGSNSPTVKSDIHPTCDWANVVQKSGLLDIVNSGFNNLLGLWATYWWIPLVISVIGALVTLLVATQTNRGHWGRTVKILLVGFGAIAIISGAVSLGHGPTACS